MTLISLEIVLGLSAIIMLESYAKREWNWFFVSLALAFCCGLGIYFKLLGQI